MIRAIGHAVVTGGASGIGKAIVAALVARGAHVVLADIDAEQAARAASELGATVTSARCDVADHASVESLADLAYARLGRVDAVFANAGVIADGRLVDASPAVVDWLFGVNVRGVWNTASVFARRMEASGQPGHLCLTASEHAFGLQHAGAGLYTASKHAVLGLAEVLRAETGQDVGFSVLCPGLASTSLHRTRRHGPLGEGSPAELAGGDAIMAEGMPAQAVAEAAVKGVLRGDFYIVTHPSAFRAARVRFEELSAAFDAQAPWTPEADRYDVNAVLHRVRTQSSKK